MNQEALLPILILALPIFCGGIIAALNSEGINRTSESLEALARRRQGIASTKKGFFSRWIVRPPLSFVTKLSDWTDTIAHRGLKNGIRAAATLYVLGFWLLLLSYAFMFVLVLAFVVISFVVALWIIGQVFGDKSSPSLPAFGSRKREKTPGEGGVLLASGGRGQKVYAGSSWLSEELKGRVDEDGNIYSGASWLSEEKVGRIDEEGNIFRGTSWLSEEKVGRIDSDGVIQKGASWWSEERVGRVDEEGNVYQGASWLDEKKIGRTETA